MVVIGGKVSANKKAEETKKPKAEAKKTAKKTGTKADKA